MSTTCWLFRGESGPLCTMYFDTHQWERMTLSLIVIFQVPREKRKRTWQIQVVGRPCTDSLTLPSGLLGHHWLSNTYLRVLGWRSVPVPGWPWWHLDPFNMSFRSLSPRKTFLPLSISKSLSLWYALNENNRHCKTPVSSGILEMLWASVILWWAKAPSNYLGCVVSTGNIASVPKWYCDALQGEPDALTSALDNLLTQNFI